MPLQSTIAVNTLVEVALNSAVGAVVGLIVALVAFPFRWWIQRRSEVRHENRAAYSAALRLIRSAELNERYAPPVPGTEQVAAREARRSWDEAEHALEESRDRDTCDGFSRVADLWRRGNAPQCFYGHAGASRRPELTEVAREFLLHKLRYPRKKAPDLEPLLSEIEQDIESAESELEEQRRLEVEAFHDWRRERDSERQSGESP